MYYHLVGLENAYTLGDICPAAFCLHSKKLLPKTLYFKDKSLSITPHNPKLVPQNIGNEKEHAGFPPTLSTDLML